MNRDDKSWIIAVDRRDSACGISNGDGRTKVIMTKNGQVSMYITGNKTTVAELQWVVKVAGEHREFANGWRSSA